MDVIVFIQTEFFDGMTEPPTPTLIICHDEDGFDKKVSKHLEDYYDERYNESCGYTKKEYIKKVLNGIYSYEEVYDPIEPNVKFEREYHKIF